MFKKVHLTMALAVLCSLFLGGTAQAEWPERPVKFVLGSQAGSSIDMVGRAIAQQLSDRFGQPFVANNISGGGLGAFPMTMKNAKPDGYTIGLGADANFSYNSLDPAARFSADDVEYVCSIFVGDSSYVVDASKGWKDMREALEWSRDNNTPLNYMFQSPLDRMTTEMYAKQIGAKLNLIPSPGPSAILTSLMGGHADIGFSGGLHFEQARAGKIRTLTIALPERSPNYPDVPSVSELFDPWFHTADGYRIIVVPKGFPAAEKAKLAAALQEIITSPQFKATVEDKLHYVVRYHGEEALTAIIQKQLAAHKELMALSQ